MKIHVGAILVAMLCSLCGCGLPGDHRAAPDSAGFNLYSGDVSIQADLIEYPSESVTLATGRPIALFADGATLAANRISLTSSPDGNRTLTASGDVTILSAYRGTKVASRELSIRVLPQRQVSIDKRSAVSARAESAGSGPVQSSPGTAIYVVQSGDSLAGLALTVYGDRNEWRRIYDANRDLLQDGPLKPGLELVIPDLNAAPGRPKPRKEVAAQYPQPPKAQK